MSNTLQVSWGRTNLRSARGSTEQYTNIFVLKAPVIFVLSGLNLFEVKTNKMANCIYFFVLTFNKLFQAMRNKRNSDFKNKKLLSPRKIEKANRKIEKAKCFLNNLHSCLCTYFLINFRKSSRALPDWVCLIYLMSTA